MPNQIFCTSKSFKILHLQKLILIILKLRLGTISLQKQKRRRENNKFTFCATQIGGYKIAELCLNSPLPSLPSALLRNLQF